MVVAGALVEISGEFHDKLFIRLLKTEEGTASSASMLAMPLIIVHLKVFSCFSTHGLITFNTIATAL